MIYEYMIYVYMLNICIDHGMCSCVHIFISFLMEIPQNAYQSDSTEILLIGSC